LTQPKALHVARPWEVAARHRIGAGVEGNKIAAPQL
jgi:hypothetical protein